MSLVTIKTPGCGVTYKPLRGVAGCDTVTMETRGVTHSHNRITPIYQPHAHYMTGWYDIHALFHSVSPFLSLALTANRASIRST